ncbi:hypothetical protein M3J07_001913 [Ascochyta lentis]
MGAWSSGLQTHDQCLRKFENARVRLSKVLPDRVKKPLVVIHHPNQATGSACYGGLSTDATPTRAGTDRTCPRHRIPRQHYALLGMIGFMMLTAVWSGSSFHYTDKAKISSIRRLVFATTSLMALETFVIMLVARRTLLEASLLGLFPLMTGFMFLLHLDNLI